MCVHVYTCCVHIHVHLGIKGPCVHIRFYIHDHKSVPILCTCICSNAYIQLFEDACVHVHVYCVCVQGRLMAVEAKMRFVLGI